VNAERFVQKDPKMKEFIDLLKDLGIGFFGDETRILIWANIKSVVISPIPAIELIQDDAKIKVEDLLVAKRLVIEKAGYEKEVLLGKNIQVKYDHPYLFIEKALEVQYK
jgi:hypothetical protein